MKSLMESLVAAAKEAKLKESRRKKIPTQRTEIPVTKNPTENSDQECFDEFLKFQIFLQKSMLCNDAVQEQETAQKKRKSVLNFSEPPRYDAEKSKNSDPRPSNGIVFREPPRYGAEKPQKSKTAKTDGSREERLKHEKSLKKPMICNGDDNNQETAQRKRKLDHNFEKKNVDSGISRRPLSEDVRMKIVQKAVEGEPPESPEKQVEPVLVIQKVLQMSDIQKDQNRITIPLAQLENIFLSDEEDQYLHIKHAGRTNYYIVPIIEPSGRVPQLNLRRWNVGKNSVSYVLNGGWKDVVAYNQLEEGQTVQLWAFRVKGILNLAFVILPDHHHQQQKQKKQRCSSVEMAMSAAQALALINRYQNNGLKTASASASDHDNGETSTSRSEASEMRWTLDLNVDPREDMDACFE